MRVRAGVTVERWHQQRCGGASEDCSGCGRDEHGYRLDAHFLEVSADCADEGRASEEDCVQDLTVETHGWSIRDLDDSERDLATEVCWDAFLAEQQALTAQLPALLAEARKTTAAIARAVEAAVREGRVEDARRLVARVDAVAREAA